MLKNRIVILVFAVFLLGVGIGFGAIASAAFQTGAESTTTGAILAQTEEESSTAEIVPFEEALVDQEGILVSGVVVDSPAAKAGLQRGDIVLAVNGTEVGLGSSFHQLLAGLEDGATVTLTVKRGDEEITLTGTADSTQPFFGILACGGRGMGRGHGFGFAVSGTPGAMVVAVVADSPAAEAGLQAGDVIVSVNGTALGAGNSLATLIAGMKPGDKVTLEIARTDSATATTANQTVEVTLGENPESAGTPYLGIHYGGHHFGFAGQALTPGITVLEVVADSPAAAAGLQAGDIITAVDGTTINTPHELIATLAAYADGDNVTLTVTSGGEEKEVVVTLTTNEAGNLYLGVNIGEMRGRHGGGGRGHHGGPFGGNGGGTGFQFFDNLIPDTNQTQPTQPLTGQDA